MDCWNREELYAEVWVTPLTKLAAKYKVSAVEIGKVCRKLQVPLPGRGHWAKKEFGKAPAPTPLPAAKNLPVVQRIPQTRREASTFNEPVDPNDPEIVHITSVEQKDFSAFLESKQHKLVSQAEKSYKHGQIDNHGILACRNTQPILDIRVSKQNLERALRILNAIILALEAEGFGISLNASKQTSAAAIFGQDVLFAIVEKLKMSRREVKHTSWTETVTEYTLSGILELRLGNTGYGWSKSVSDGNTTRLENMTAKSVGKLMRQARQQRITHENRVKSEAEFERKRIAREELASQIAEEEKKVKDLERWVENWDKAERMRRFVTALEKVWRDGGIDVSPDSAKGKRLTWMRQQADRVDPMLESPPSILDKKGDISYW